MKIKEKIYTTTKKFLIELLLKQISEEFKNLQCVKVEKKGLYTYNSEAINESVEEMVSLSKIFNNNAENLIALSNDFEFLNSKECKDMTYDDFLEHDFKYKHYTIKAEIKYD